MKPATIGWLALFLVQLEVSAIAAVAQASPSDTHSPEITFRTSSNLVLVNVMAIKNGLPEKTLRRDDFLILDNGHPVSIKTFDSGANLTTRSVALWFVVQCRMQDYDAQGSGFFRGRISLFKPALAGVDAKDKVAVAHWCDDGESKLDLLPTSKIDEAATVLEQVLTPTFDSEDHDRAGELALQETLQHIIDATHSLLPEPVPVVIFLYGDHSGMPRSEADHFINELLATSAIVYGLKDRRSPGILFLLGEQKEIAHYIATETGGQYLRLTPETYATGLEKILEQLHFRYELGFRPEALDGKRHKLRVKLAEAAKKQHQGVRLRYRAAYVPVASR